MCSVAAASSETRRRAARAAVSTPGSHRRYIALMGLPFHSARHLSADSLRTRDDGLEQRAVALQRRALHVEPHAAQVPELLAAAGAPGAAVHQLRKYGARPEPRAGDLGA